MVELFVTRYPATRQQKNKTNETALQIAQKRGFKRIAHVLETGQAGSDDVMDMKPKESKLTRDELIQAAKTGHLTVIKAFIAERYSSRDEKRKICGELITVGKEAKQHEVTNVLQPYYDRELAAELPSNIGMGGGISLSEQQEKILRGFLDSLGEIITESGVSLDFDNPDTYKELFSNLMSNERDRAEKTDKIGSEREAKALSEEDMKGMDEKLNKINGELERLNEGKRTLQKNIKDIEEKLMESESLSASQRLELLRVKEGHKDQLAVYVRSRYLYERQHEATFTRKNLIDFFKKSSNTYLFFRTIENRLQMLFHGVLAAQSGLLSTNTDAGGMFSKVLGSLPSSKLSVRKYDWLFCAYSCRKPLLPKLLLYSFNDN